MTEQQHITILLDFGDGQGEKEYTVPITNEVREHLTHAYPNISLPEGFDYDEDEKEDTP